MPDGLAQRVRLLFAAFALLVAPLSALRLLEVGAPLLPRGVAVLTALLVVAVWAWRQYRSGGLPWWVDPVPVVAVFVVGWGLGGAESVFGLMFVLLFGRALYGTGPRVWLNGLAYFIAHEAVDAVLGGVSAVVDVSLVVTGLGVLFSTGVMLLVGAVLRMHEGATRREEVLARAVSRLQGARTHDEVHEVATDGALALVGEIPHTAVTMWRGDERVIRMGRGAGEVAADTPPEVPMDMLPADVRQAMLAGAPFLLDEEACALVQQSVEMDRTYVSMLLAPLMHDGHFGGVLCALSRAPLPDEIVSALGRLALDVGLALDRADSATLLNRVVQSSSDVIMLLDRDLRVGFASRAAATLFGCATEDLVGQQADDLLTAPGASLRAVLESTAAHADELLEVVLARGVEGTERQVELAATRLPEGRRDGWVVNLRDVTRRTEVEHALRASEHQFRSLAENVSEGMYQMTLRPEPRYLYVNPAMEAMTGFPAQAFLDDVDLTIRRVHPDDGALVERTRSTPDDLDWPVDVRWCRPSGEWVWISFRETVVHDADGAAVGLMGILSDITAQKVQEQALQDALGREREASDRLRRVDAMRTTFIQAVSHELRTPLTAIIGHSHTLHRSMDMLDHDTQTTLLERLEANAHKLDRLLADLLDVDRLSSHEIEPVRRQVDVVQLVHRVVEQIDGSTHPVRCDGGSVLARVDAPKVERIVENLVRNARKHTAPGTPISVTVAPDGAGDGVVLTVADEGPGIPNELMATIFDPFVQGAGSASSATPGMGIGLSLVARFAEMHGGHARVRNRDGGGAVFEVLLPGRSPRSGLHEPLPAGAPAGDIAAS